MPISQDQVLDALRRVIDPDLHRDIVSLGFVKDLVIKGGNIAFKVELTTPACPVKELLQEQCRTEVASISGVETVEVEMTAQVRARPTAPEDLLPGVKHCIAIASGKGGVGKSTITVNLAIALSQSGASVGVLDADVYGPSIPLMMGCDAERPITRDHKIMPIERFGISMMSMGFLLEEGQAVMWRGPMVAGTVKQLLTDVDWGELDYLLVDLPPGTGDAPMSLAQLAPLSGVVIVTTPHQIAANIAGKSAALFRRLNTPLLGVVENMAEFVCPSCGSESRIFSGTTGRDFAASLGTAFLGSVPLDPAISQAGDQGIPASILNPEGHHGRIFRDIAGQLAAQASVLSHSRRSSTETPRFQAVS